MADIGRIINHQDGLNIIAELNRIAGNETQISENKTQISELHDDLGVLESRVTNLATLSEGSTTGDAELIDGRVGADGTVHASIGEANRKQFSDLKSEISDIGERTGIDKTVIDSNSDFVNVNQCYKTDGSLEGYSGWNTTDYIDCSTADKIIFDLVSFNEPDVNIQLATIAFFDENNSFVSGVVPDSTSSGAVYSGEADIPPTATSFKALTNSSIQSNPNVKVSITGSINEAIDALQNQLEESVSDLQTEAEEDAKTVSEIEKGSAHTGVSNFNQYTIAKYYDIQGNEYDGGTGWKVTPLLPCYGYRTMSFDVWRFNTDSLKIASVAFFDKDKSFVSGVYANYLGDGQSEFKGQCPIPDNAYYYSVVTNVTEQSYTPNVTLYGDSVEVDLTNILTTNPNVYNRDGSQAAYTGWYTTQWIPVRGFKSMSFVAGSYHSGSVQLESVTFFNSSAERIDGIFTNLPDNTTRNGKGTVPIPPTAEWAKLLYNSSESEQPSLTLHNPAHTLMNILCIGDSITEGQTAGAVTLTDNYPSNMQKNLGLGYTVFNAGVGGSQAMTWWSTWRHLLNLKSYNTDVIIIMLGANGGFEPTFDTDVDPYDDYNDYANTITGKTCALIEWLQEQLPNAEIVMATPTYINSSLAPGNASASYAQCMYMSSLVDRYHLAVIDIRNLMGISHHNSDHWLASDGVHGTPIFYQKLGMLFANQIKPIINIPNK